jgi:hypothetical protein
MNAPVQGSPSGSTKIADLTNQGERAYGRRMPRPTVKLSDGSALASDGWYAFRTREGVSVHAHLGRLGDRIVVNGVLIEADEITTDVLRQVQPTRILAYLRDDIAVIAESDEVAVIMDGPTMLALNASGISDDEVTLGELRSRTPAKVKGRRRRALGRPDGVDTDTFYGKVATAYRSAAIDSRQPATLLAEENDVPVETVRRWVKEARRRGFLPAGDKGRAG